MHSIVLDYSVFAIERVLGAYCFCLVKSLYTLTNIPEISSLHQRQSNETKMVHIRVKRKFVQQQSHLWSPDEENSIFKIPSYLIFRTYKTCTADAMYLFIEGLLPEHKREFFGIIRLLTPFMTTPLLFGE